MDNLAICLNLDILASTQYASYNFNSFTTFQGKPIGAGDGGIFLIDDQYTDNGSDIAAWFETPVTALGIDKLKRLLRAVFKYECNGDLILTVTVDEGREDVYTIQGKLIAMSNRGISFFLSKGPIGTEFSFRIENVNGSNFAVDSLSVLPVILSRYGVQRGTSAVGRIKIDPSDFTVSGND